MGAKSSRSSLVVRTFGRECSSLYTSFAGGADPCGFDQKSLHRNRPKALELRIDSGEVLPLAQARATSGEPEGRRPLAPIISHEASGYPEDAGMWIAAALPGLHTGSPRTDRQTVRGLTMTQLGTGVAPCSSAVRGGVA